MGVECKDMRVSDSRIDANMREIDKLRLSISEGEGWW